MRIRYFDINRGERLVTPNKADSGVRLDKYERVLAMLQKMCAKDFALKVSKHLLLPNHVSFSVSVQTRYSVR